MLERLIPPGFPPDILMPPPYSDEDRASQARNFHKVAWGIILIATPLIALVACVQPHVWPRVMAVIVSVDILCLILLELNRRGWTRLASGLLIGGLILRLGLNALEQGGIRSPGISMFLVLVLLAGLLTGESGTLLTAIACTLMALGLALAGNAGLLPAQTVHFNEYSLFVLNFLYMAVVIIVARLSTETIRKALGRARVELTDRRQAEQTLEMALSASEAGVWEFDRDTRLFHGDDRAFALLGIAPPADRSLALDAWQARIHPGDRLSLMKSMGRLLAKAGTSRTNYRIVRPDGAVRYIDGARTSIPGEAGRPSRVVGMVLDVTERRKAEAAIRTQGERIRLLLDSTAEAIYGVDAEGDCTFVNQACLKLLGYENAGELLGRRLHSIMHHSRADGTPYPLEECRILNASSRGEKIHVADEVLWRADKTSFPAEYWAYPIVEEGAITGAVVTFLDISERKRAEAAVRESEERYRNVVEASEEAIMAVDNDWNISLVNPKLCALLGYRAEELVGQKGPVILFPEDVPEIVERRERRRLTRHAEQFDQRLRRKDGTAVPVHTSAAGLLDAKGDYDGSIVMFTDLTARNQLQADLQQAQKIEAMGRLSGGIAHDFNNMLTATLGFAELLKMTLKADDPARDDVQQIIDTSHRAAALTRQLLAFSRKQVLQPVALDLNAVVADMEKMLKRIIGEDVKLGTKLAGELGVCRADRGQFEQVILNLVVNARDAMPDGGSITLSTANADLEAGEAEALGAAPGAFVLVAVTDTGHGMSEETQRRIFEPFFTTKPVGQGTGLGLATVHGIVKQSGGYLKVRSKLGAGTTFEVLLPAIARAQAEAPEQAKAAVRTGHETILLLDDDATIRQVARRLLSSAGYRVLEAEAGAAGFALLEREKSAVDLLITDVVMPDMSGFDFAAQARRGRPGLRVLFMSGYLDREQPQGAESAGQFYLQKPFAAEAFTAKVREVLDAQAPAA